MELVWPPYISAFQSVSNVLLASSFIGLTLTPDNGNDDTGVQQMTIYLGSLAFLSFLLGSICLLSADRLRVDILDDLKQWETIDGFRESAIRETPEGLALTEAEERQFSMVRDRIRTAFSVKRLSMKWFFQYGILFVLLGSWLLLAVIVLAAHLKIGSVSTNGLALSLMVIFIVGGVLLGLILVWGPLVPGKYAALASDPDYVDLSGTVTTTGGIDNNGWYHFYTRTWYLWNVPWPRFTMGLFCLLIIAGALPVAIIHAVSLLF